jgi:hypothetical protein
MLQPSDEILVFLLRYPALLCGLHRRDLAALGGRLIVVPLKRVAAREVITTAVAEMDLQRVRLRGLAVTLELLKVFELQVRAEAALDCMDRPPCEVGLQSLEEQLIPRLEFSGYLEKFCFFMVHRFLINTPLDPTWLSICGIHCPTLLETWSRQGLVVNALRTRGRESLCSASRLLGFAINPLFGDPGRRHVAGPSRGPCCLRDPLNSPPTAPGLLLGPHFVGMGPLAFITLRQLCLAMTFPDGRSGCVCHCRI